MSNKAYLGCFPGNYFSAAALMRYCFSSSLHTVTISALTSLFLLGTMKSKQTVYLQMQIVALVCPLFLQ